MKIIFIDVEGTGLNIQESEMLTLHAIKCNLTEIIEEESFRFKPVTWLDRYDPSTAIHGITRYDVIDYPNKYSELLRFLDFCGEDNLFFCHANKNNMGKTFSYDYAIIEQEMMDNDLLAEFRKAFYPCKSYSTHSMCKDADRDGLISVPSTIKDGNKRASKSFNLKGMCKLFNIPLDGHHDASVDSKACYNIFKKIYDINPQWVIDNINKGH